MMTHPNTEELVAFFFVFLLKELYIVRESIVLGNKLKIKALGW